MPIVLSQTVASLNFLPQKIRENPDLLPLYPKLTSMMDHVVNQALTDLNDVRLKYAGPNVVSNDVIAEIISENGFDYIRSVMDTITGSQFNLLAEFLMFINLLKGSRDGLALVLMLLGFEAVMTEWWEQDPPGPPMTFDLIAVMPNPASLTDPLKTKVSLEVFIRNYVYPLLAHFELRVGSIFTVKNINVGGFPRAYYSGSVEGRI